MCPRSQRAVHGQKGANCAPFGPTKAAQCRCVALRISAHRTSLVRGMSDPRRPVSWLAARCGTARLPRHPPSGCETKGVSLCAPTCRLQLQGQPNRRKTPSDFVPVKPSSGIGVVNAATLAGRASHNVLLTRSVKDQHCTVTLQPVFPLLSALRKERTILESDAG